MRKQTPTPHDLVFKTFLSTMETARFYRNPSSPALLQLCDLQTLQLEFEAYRRRLTSLFQRCCTRLKPLCGDGYIHVL